MFIIKFGVVTVEGTNVTVENFAVVGDDAASHEEMVAIEALTYTKHVIDDHIQQLKQRVAMKTLSTVH